MAVQPHRTTWTDDRLDDLVQTIRDGFARNDSDRRLIREEMREYSRQNTLDHQLIRQEMRDGFKRNEAEHQLLRDEYQSLRNETREGFERADVRLDALRASLSGQIGSLHRLLLTLLITTIGGMVGVIGAILANGRGWF